MINECKNHLVAALLAAGFTTKQIHPVEKMKTAFEVVPSALMLESKEQLTRNKRRVKFEDNLISGIRTWRYKLFNRVIVIPLVIAAKDENELEVLYLGLLSNLVTRIFDAGNNAILVSFREAVESIVDDSILRGKAGKQLEVEFSGGVYQDQESHLYTPDNIVIETEWEV